MEGATCEVVHGSVEGGICDKTAWQVAYGFFSDAMSEAYFDEQCKDDNGDAALNNVMEGVTCDFVNENTPGGICGLTAWQLAFGVEKAKQVDELSAVRPPHPPSALPPTIPPQYRYASSSSARPLKHPPPKFAAHIFP